jgi:hypothetical protein
LIYLCCLAGDEVRIHSHANEISMPRHAAEALTFALETPRFQIGELPSSLDDAGKLTLIRRLIREGLVVTFP